MSAPCPNHPRSPSLWEILRSFVSPSRCPEPSIDTHEPDNKAEILRQFKPC